MSACIATDGQKRSIQERPFTEMTSGSLSECSEGEQCAPLLQKDEGGWGPALCTDAHATIQVLRANLQGEPRFGLRNLVAVGASVFGFQPKPRWGG